MPSDDRNSRRHVGTDWWQRIEIVEMLRPFVLLLRHRYCPVKNIKSIRELVMFRNEKWNSRSFIKRTKLFFYILLTVHLITVFINKKLDAQFFFLYLFIPILYMFRATKCSSSGGSIVSIRSLVFVTLKILDHSTVFRVTYNGGLIGTIEFHIGSTWLLETCREME
jgi:hypothetical protein